MKLRSVDPRAIKIPDVRVTSQMDQETLEQFQATVKSWGIESPILAFEVNGELWLVDGKHRLDQALENGLARVDVVVREGSMVDVLTRNVFLDHLRGKHKVTDMVRVLGHLYNEEGLDVDQIREKTGLTREYVEKLLKLSATGPVILAALEDGLIGVGQATQLARLPLMEQQEELIEKLKVFRWPIAELRSFVDEVLRNMQQAAEEGPADQPPPPPPPPMPTCQVCKSEMSPSQLRTVTVCPDCFGAVWRIQRERRTEPAEVPADGGGA